MAGGSRPTPAALGDGSVIVASVEQTAGSHVTTSSQTTARLQGQKFCNSPNLCHTISFRYRTYQC